MTVNDVNNKVVTTDYEYDLRNRLQVETKEYSGTTEILNYRYDFNGNQIHRQWEKFSPKKEKKTPGRVGFTTDKFKEDVVILEMREYNGFNELTYIYRDAYETRYTYRPDGLRHKKLFADGTTLSHIWDGPDIVAEYGANGNITARYLRGINLVARDQDNLLQYYLFNAHGDVTQRTDQNGTALKNYDYDAFGVEKNPEILDVNPWRFCGEYFDREGDTLYLRARNYLAYNGRMLGEDSVRSITDELPNGQEVVDPLSLNLYSYCYNNPLKFTDPSGNVALVDDAVIILVLATGTVITVSYDFLSSPEGQQMLMDGATAIYNGFVIAGDTITSAASHIVDGIIAGGEWTEAKANEAWNWATGLLLAKNAHGDKTVQEVLKEKKGSIKNAPIPPGGPNWKDLMPLTMEEIRKLAQKGETGYREIWKLLTDKRFNR